MDVRQEFVERLEKLEKMVLELRDLVVADRCCPAKDETENTIYLEVERVTNGYVVLEPTSNTKVVAVGEDDALYSVLANIVKGKWGSSRVVNGH